MPGASNKMHSRALSGSEVFEVGNASMEYDAALDAMTIDANHENALGMEGVDMYQNKLAAMGAKMDTMNVDEDGDGITDGIDFDGDGKVDVSASKPGQLMKFSEFKPPGLNVHTGESMHCNPACELTDYSTESNGIIPGYAGHIPRARDKYGGSAHTGTSPAIVGIANHIGPQGGHNKGAVLGNGFGNDGYPLRGAAIEPVFENFSGTVGGVMPGYAGFKPGARDESGYATYGGIQRFGRSYNRQEPTEAQTATTHTKPGFVAHAGGVLPGYTGYVPTAKETYGISHYGSIEGGPTFTGPTQFAATGHKQVKGDMVIDVSKQYKAGYSGHVPKARDTFGGAHYGIGSHKSPDGYKKAAPKRHLHDMRDIVGDNIDVLYGATGVYHDGDSFAADQH